MTLETIITLFMNLCMVHNGSLSHARLIQQMQFECFHRRLECIDKYEKDKNATEESFKKCFVEDL